MKTSITNGYNVSTLNWDYFITLNRVIPTSVTRWETEINRIMDANDFSQMYWTCEMTKYIKGTYHSHLLVETKNDTCTHEDMIAYFSKYIVKGKEISYKSASTSEIKKNETKEIDGKRIIYDPCSQQNKRLLEYKSTQNLIGPNNETMKREVIATEYIPFTEIHGRDGRVYIEKIRGVRNASIYINKFTDRGITTGYLKS